LTTLTRPDFPVNDLGVAANRGSADVWPAPTPYPVTLPWLNVAVALLVVPAVAMLGAGLLTRSRLPIERRL